MITFVRKEFTVDVPLERVWEYVTRFDEWPKWAKHIKRIEFESGELKLGSKGKFYFKLGLKAIFEVNELHSLRNWKWRGPTLWLNVETDHIFLPIDNYHTKLTWTWACEGFGEIIVGRILGVLVNEQWSVASKLLTSQLNAMYHYQGVSP